MAYLKGVALGVVGAFLTALSIGALTYILIPTELHESTLMRFFGTVLMFLGMSVSISLALQKWRLLVISICTVIGSVFMWLQYHLGHTVPLVTYLDINHPFLKALILLSVIAIVNTFIIKRLA